ncbi:MAG: N-6 DNA methylase [bacterium]|nr:N-6 DNA methylase [bacterium]MCP5030286.1 N-6 DNA methylase [Actinomycetes bacterium]
MSRPALLTREETAEHLRALADSLNSGLESGTDRGGRATKGQFTTPSEAATAIVELLDMGDLDEYQILDPGAGSGALMLNLVALAIENGVTARLVVDLVECDESALHLLNDAVAGARLAADSHDLGIELNIIDADFLDLDSWTYRTYDIAVMNPPYSKLGQDAQSRKVTQRLVGADCPNIYAAFVATALSLLAEHGQLVAITPRSFANGRYFLDFRRFVTDLSGFTHVVLFDRRDKIFRSSAVLQETVIFRLVKSTSPNSISAVVETRHDHETSAYDTHEVPQSTITARDDPDRFINLPGSPDVMAVAERLRSYDETLTSLGVSVSTGPVVDFRAKEFLAGPEDPDTVPLIYPVNVRPDGISWPLGGGKAQGFIRTPASARQLYPNGCYVVVKRFTSKEEKRRVVAAIYEPIDGYSEVAFENHVNVIHQNKSPLPRDLAEQIAEYLNSEDVDVFFRMFSGNTQVNATDLRRLHVPMQRRDDLTLDLSGDGAQGSLFGSEVLA